MDNDKLFLLAHPEYLIPDKVISNQILSYNYPHHFFAMLAPDIKYPFYDVFLIILF